MIFAATVTLSGQSRSPEVPPDKTYRWFYENALLLKSSGFFEYKGWFK